MASLAIGLALAAPPVLAQLCAPVEASTLKLRLSVGDQVLTATLRDAETARDFTHCSRSR